jgi:beta-ribofuranosylaminobenzene 5'-phosphate synthase
MVPGVNTVSTGSRLHCALLDLGRATSRAYGGAGFMVDGPRTVVTAEPDSAWDLEVTFSTEPRLVTDVEALFSRFTQYTSECAKVRIEAFPPAHLGLGSKTSLMLCVATALSDAFGLRLRKEQLQTLTGRGGTSGIGINGFFEGGFVVDRGHPQRDVRSFGPSSTRTPNAIPPLAISLPIPEQWRFLLLTIPDSPRLAGADESRFFLKHTPVAASEVFESISIVYHDLASAVAASEIAATASALAALHTLGFKRSELGAQSDATRALLRSCTAEGFAAGLSSMGPLIYAISDAEGRLRELERNAVGSGAASLGVFSGMRRR